MFNHFKVMNAVTSNVVELLKWQCEQFLVYYVIVLTVMGVPDFQTHRGHWLQLNGPLGPMICGQWA